MSCEKREGLQSDERYLFTEVLGAYPKITIRYHTSSVGSVYEGMDAWGIPPNWCEPVFRLHQRHEQEALPQARRRQWCTRLTARVAPGVLPPGAERVTQARTAHEACRPDPRARPALQPWMALGGPE